MTACFKDGVPPTAVYLVKPRVNGVYGRILDVLRGIEVGFACAEADDVLAFGFESGGTCGDGEGGGGLDGLNALREFQLGSLGAGGAGGMNTPRDKQYLMINERAILPVIATFPNSPFRLHQPFLPAGDQPAAIDKLVEGIQRRSCISDAARRDRLGQDLHHGQRDRPARASGDRHGAQQDAGGAAVLGDARVFSGKLRSSILFPITTTISRKPMCRRAICLSRKIPASTSTSSRCACPPPRRCWSATTA